MVERGYKRIYFSFAGITTLLGLLFLLNTLGLDITSDGDKFCVGDYDNPCLSYINISNPTAKNIYIYNRAEVLLDFSPRVKDYAFYVKDGRCKKNGFRMEYPTSSCGCIVSDGAFYKKGWRCVDFTSRTKANKDRKYVYLWPRRTTKQHLLVGFKDNLADNIKWTIGTAGSELDPLWASDNFSYEYTCTPYYVNESFRVRKSRIVVYDVYGVCRNDSAPNGTSSCLTGQDSYNQSYWVTEIKSVPYKTCVRDKIRVGDNYNIEYGTFGNCFGDRPNRRVCCVSDKDGNGDTIIQPGESYYCNDIYGNEVSDYSASKLSRVKRLSR